MKKSESRQRVNEEPLKYLTLTAQPGRNESERRQRVNEEHLKYLTLTAQPGGNELNKQ